MLTKTDTRHERTALVLNRAAVGEPVTLRDLAQELASIQGLPPKMVGLDAGVMDVRLLRFAYVLLQAAQLATQDQAAADRIAQVLGCSKVTLAAYGPIGMASGHAHITAQPPAPSAPHPAVSITGDRPCPSPGQQGRSLDPMHPGYAQ